MTDDRVMRQEAPYPVLLEELVAALEYRRGWSFSLVDMDRGQGSKGLTFSAAGTYPDTYDPGTLIRVRHLFIVPAASYNELSWTVWLSDRLKDIENHESNEFFQVGGVRPFAPQHGPGNDPYVTFVHGSDLERRTRFDGTVADA